MIRRGDARNDHRELARCFWLKFLICGLGWERISGSSQRRGVHLFCEESILGQQLARELPQSHSRWQLPDHAPNGGTTSRVWRDVFPKTERQGRENVHHILAPPPKAARAN